MKVCFIRFREVEFRSYLLERDFILFGRIWIIVFIFFLMFVE